MIHPTLYKKTQTGAIQRWTIDVIGNQIQTIWGQVDGALQSTVETIAEGKNPGKANATTPEQQAEKEAKARWTKQLKKGYVQHIEDAKDGLVDEIIEGGIRPMLAPTKIYPTFAHKLTWPIYCQPKLDGSRCIAIVKDGVCTLWSRTRKQIHSVPHIVKALEDRFSGGDIILDGELYNHDYREDFEILMSKIRPDEPVEGHEAIQYHVYDLPSWEGFFAERSRALFELLEGIEAPIVRVNTCMADNHNNLLVLHEGNLEEGYEGSMVRNDGPYEYGKRSFHLQKFKSFVDGEFPILRIEEGRGKDAGTVGAFICRREDGGEVKARLKTTYDRRRELFQKPQLWQGKSMTISYQNLTADGSLRFPIGKGIRAD